MCCLFFKQEISSKEIQTCSKYTSGPHLSPMNCKACSPVVAFESSASTFIHTDFATSTGHSARDLQRAHLLPGTAQVPPFSSLDAKC